MRSILVLLLSVWLMPPTLAAEAEVQLVAATTAGRTSEVRDLLVQGVDANTKNGSGRPVLVVVLLCFC